MESDNTSKRDLQVPRAPADAELQLMTNEASIRAGARGESARPPEHAVDAIRHLARDVPLAPPEPGIDLVRHLTRDVSLAPPEPAETQLAHLITRSAHAINASARAAEGGGALQPREPTETEIRELLGRG